MPYTAHTLITRAWYLSGIVARGLQTVTGDQINDGLYLLNALLDFKQISTDLIPYWQYIELPAVPSQEYYYLPYVAAIESCTFNLDVVRYSMVPTSRFNYYAGSRVDNITTLPFNYNYNRALGGGNLALYFVPDQAYPLKIMAKIFLVDVSLSTDMTNISELVPYTFINSSNQGYDTSYLEYLRYALANYMCSEYGIMFNPESAKVLKSMEHRLMYIDPPDLSMQKYSTLGEVSPLSWAQVNLGRGYVPS